MHTPIDGALVSVRLCNVYLSTTIQRAFTLTVVISDWSCSRRGEGSEDCCSATCSLALTSSNSRESWWTRSSYSRVLGRGVGGKGEGWREEGGRGRWNNPPMKRQGGNGLSQCTVQISTKQHRGFTCTVPVFSDHVL